MEDFQKHFVVVDEEPLDSGAFGTVFKVKHRNGHATLALKVFNVEEYNVEVDDAQEEFSVMKSLRHQNILTVIDFITSDNDPDTFAILMEYCRKGDLFRYLNKRERHLSKKNLLEWMIELASAVKYMHSKDIMHRDLKPDNILLSEETTLLISDFGIAKIMTQYYANTEGGTRDFMAPEVPRGDYTKKADIFSLGKVFICMATLGDVNFDPQDIGRYGSMIADAMKSCTEDNPKDRLDASNLLTLLEVI